MHGVEGFAVQNRKRARGERANEEGAEETRGVRDSDGVDICP